MAGRGHARLWPPALKFRFFTTFIEEPRGRYSLQDRAAPGRSLGRQANSSYRRIRRGLRNDLPRGIRSKSYLDFGVAAIWELDLFGGLRRGEEHIQSKLYDDGDLRLANRDAVRFLRACEADGMKLENCPAYIRRWMDRD